MTNNNQVEPVAKHDLELELKALKSDLRLMIIASVAFNQLLAHIILPTSITAVAIVSAILAPFAKAGLAILTRH